MGFKIAKLEFTRLEFLRKLQQVGQHSFKPFPIQTKEKQMIVFINQ